MQKVHLWMEISADCPNRGRRSLTKMDRLRNVQSSVWTLQQILPDGYDNRKWIVPYDRLISVCLFLSYNNFTLFGIGKSIDNC